MLSSRYAMVIAVSSPSVVSPSVVVYDLRKRFTDALAGLALLKVLGKVLQAAGIAHGDDHDHAVRVGDFEGGAHLILFPAGHRVYNQPLIDALQDQIFGRHAA